MSAVVSRLLDEATRTDFLPSALLVSFAVKRLPDALAVWANGCYEDGGAVATGVPGIVENTFAVSVAGDDSLSEPRSPDDGIIAYADRYGGYGVGCHGGSGRCGFVGSVQVKGIGRTPLVGRGGDQAHSHGFMTLEEAIREAVFSRFFKIILPHGIVETLGVIDTGDCMPWGERKGLLLRPAFFRASALVRAPFFNPAAEMKDPHIVDVARVTAALKILDEPAESRARYGFRIGSLKAFLVRACEQLAACHFHQAYPGPFSTSNLTINGALLDFGSARIVPGFRRYVSVGGGTAFGVEDVALLALCLQDIRWHVRTYGPESQFDDCPSDLRTYVFSTYAKTIINLFKMREALPELENFLSEQLRPRVLLDIEFTRRPPLDDVEADVVEVISTVRDLLRDNGGALQSPVRLVPSLVGPDRAGLQSAIYAVTESQPAGRLSQRSLRDLSKLIDGC